MKCSNCGAKGEDFGIGIHGEIICCPACIFNPLGCRCQFGEFGVPETYEDPDFPMFDDVDGAAYDFSDYYEPKDGS